MKFKNIIWLIIIGWLVGFGLLHGFVMTPDYPYNLISYAVIIFFPVLWYFLYVRNK